MKLITSKGQLPLPDDFEFTIEQNSPFFSNEGAATIPVTIPVTQDALAKLGHPERVAGRDKFLRKISAQLQVGVFHKDGQLVIDSLSKKGGITASLAIAESDIYAQYKDKSIKDVFANSIRNDFEGAQDPVASWVDYIWQCSAGAVSDDFTAFPVLTDKKESEEDGVTNITYIMLNQPKASSDATPAKFVWESRTIQTSNGLEVVPPGYGITPFIFLRRLVVLFFSKMGYTVNNNFFTSGEILPKIVLMNNTADALCEGYLDLADLVPSCTVSEFFDFLENKFNVQVFVSPEKSEVDILCLDSTLTGSIELDISSKIDGEIEIHLEDPSHMVLSSDISLEGAEPPEENYKLFLEKYPIIEELDEASFARSALTFCVVKRLATGDYYLVKRKMLTDERSLERMGSSYFKYDRGNADKAEERSSADLAAPVVIYGGLTACFIGDRQHRHTSYNTESKDSNQDIILAFDAGMAVNDDMHTLKYRLGTTQKYNNIGVLWGTANLVPEDLYFLYFKEFNKILLNCSTSLAAKVDFTIKDILNLNLSKLMLYDGTSLLTKKITYSVGKKLSGGQCEFLVVKDYSEIMQDSRMSPERQLYGWGYADNLSSVLAYYENQGMTVTAYNYEAIEDDPLVYLPPPTFTQQSSFKSIRGVVIGVSEVDDQGVTRSWDENDSVEYWYGSYEL